MIRARESLTNTMTNASANGDAFIGSPRIDVSPPRHDDWERREQKVSSVVLIAGIARTERRTPRSDLTS